MFNKQYLKVYFICGTQDVPENSSIKEILTKALEAGITMFQFREKGTTALKGQAKVKLARQLCALCHRYQVPFIVNDDVALAEEINADGIHVGQDDLDVSTFAKQFNDKIIGLSVSDIEEYNRSDLTYVDYIGVGPMYATTSKGDANAPVGPEMIPQLRNYIDNFPIVAIGGISLENASDVIYAGADGLSLISAIAKSEHVEQTVQQFLQTVE